jgi:penicillin amidase
MNLVFRWLLRVASLMIFLIVGAFGLAYFFASRSLPDYNAEVSVAGLNAPVEIIRDNANVPHVFGRMDDDVFFGLGYAHAQDRLWQMTMLRRTAQGRLSELFGERTLSIDSVIRRLDIYNLAVQSVDVQDDRTKEALVAYSAGVNAWLAEINKGALGRGAPEMFLFNHAVAPWQPADSLAITKLMALQLSSHLDAEVLRARSSLALSSDRLVDILPDAPGTGLAALPEYAALIPELPQYFASFETAADPLSPFKRRDLAGASNAWAAGPSRSAAGSTLLANDPHLGLTAPAIWYLARLELSSGGVIGGTIPGMPVILTGRSADLGWGLTSSYVDVQDVYVEQLNPENPNEYLTPNGFQPFRSRDTIVLVKDAPAVTLKLQWTENGPVLPGEHYDLATITPPGHVASVAWTVLTGADTSMSSAMALMRARSVQEGLLAAETYIAPSQNLTLADRNTIAMKTIGAMPRRNVDHQSKGRLPTQGRIAANRWSGNLPYSMNPEFVEPSGGILGNTNNKTIERPFPNHVSYRWGDTQRVNRWRRLMQTREVHTRESFI